MFSILSQRNSSAKEVQSSGQKLHSLFTFVKLKISKSRDFAFLNEKNIDLVVIKNLNCERKPVIYILNDEYLSFLLVDYLWVWIRDDFVSDTFPNSKFTDKKEIDISTELLMITNSNHFQHPHRYFRFVSCKGSSKNPKNHGIPITIKKCQNHHIFDVSSVAPISNFSPMKISSWAIYMFKTY